MKTLTLSGLTAMTLEPIFSSMRRAWLRGLIGHLDMSADVEMGIAKAAHKNAAFYQRRAALARSELRALIGVPTERRGSWLKRVLFGLFNRKSQ